MVKSALAETSRADNFGAISRSKNTRRYWVAPSLISVLAVTGTWALEANTNAVSLATNDVGGATELLHVPYIGPVSDAAMEGSSNAGAGGTDRGIRVIGLEVMYEIADTALATIAISLYKTTFDGEGGAAAAAITSALTTDDADATPVEVDQHRIMKTIAVRDRFFLDSGTVIHATLDLADGTASDMNIFGAFWHVEEVME